jgi:hypothetical protein
LNSPSLKKALSYFVDRDNKFTLSNSKLRSVTYREDRPEQLQHPSQLFRSPSQRQQTLPPSATNATRSSHSLDIPNRASTSTQTLTSQHRNHLGMSHSFQNIWQTE